jgi:hypothetical protein
VTRHEAEAARVVLRWIFNRKPLVEPPKLEIALLTLGQGAGLSRRQLREWMKS